MAKNKCAVSLGRKGGRARASKYTREQLAAFARKGAIKRKRRANRQKLRGRLGRRKRK